MSLQFDILNFFSYFCSLPTATVIYLGPNRVLVAENATGGTFPIMAYSTRDNASLTYQFRFNPIEYITLPENGSVLTIAPGIPVGNYFFDVS